MIPEFGLFCLILGFCFSISLAMILPISRWSHRSLVDTYKTVCSLVYGQCFFVLMSFCLLVYAFMQNDFSVAYVAQNSYSQLPFIYKICAVWGAHEGSLLLWSLILSFWTLGVAKITPKRHYQDPALISLSLGALAILGAINMGFLGILLKTSNPFLRLLPFSPLEGIDLNPLLQDPGFVLHPPILYMGYVGFAIPFAFALAALWLKKPALPWASLARPWTLMAWGFLTLGIALGSWWAYYELGWGGWWFWDPVENASFMPWLLGGALIHALYLNVQRGLFYSWSLLLAISVFLLSLLGTFLVRSGILSSVHSFASSPERGMYILSFLAVVLIASLGLYMARMQTWKASERLVYLSKESFMLLGNMLLAVATLTVLLGTLYPLIIEIVGKEKLSVGPPYFNLVFIPILLPVLLLMVLAPHLRWIEDDWNTFWQKMKKTAYYGLAAILIAILIAWQDLPALSLLGMGIGLLLVFGTLYSFFCANRWRNWKRWGMVAAHFGLGISVLGISLTTALETEKTLKISPGDVAHIAGYDFDFRSIKAIQGANYEGRQGHFIIKKNHKEVASLFPEKRFFIPREMPMSETAIHVGLWQDFYIALGEKLEDDSWSVRIYLKPFVRWIWLGALWIALGAWISSVVSFKEEK